MIEPYDRAYLERRLALCREKAATESDPGLARVYRSFADQYAKEIETRGQGDAPPVDVRQPSLSPSA